MLILGCEGAGNKASSEPEPTAEGATQQATREPSPIPEVGPLAHPNPMQQVGAPVDATRAAIPPTIHRPLRKYPSA